MQKQASPAPSYRALVARVRQRLEKLGRSHPIALVFAYPDHKITDEILLPRIELLDARSSDHIDFFFIGWSDFLRRSFSARAFSGCVNWIDEQSAFKYSGNPTILFLTASLGEWGEARFGFEACTPIDLVEFEKDGHSVDSLVETAIRVAHDGAPDQFTARFRDENYERHVWNLWRLVLAILPESLRSSAREANRFRPRDLRKKAPAKPRQPRKKTARKMAAKKGTKKKK